MWRDVWVGGMWRDVWVRWDVEGCMGEVGCGGMYG